MTQVDRSALVMHSAAQMYELVNDVLSYPDFLPWCADTELLEHSEQHMLARLHVAKGGFKYSFVTRNTLEEPHKVEIALVEGPFSRLHGLWTFTALSDEACKINLQLNFDFKGKLAGLAMGKVFNQIAIAMVDAFCSQADKRFG